MDMEGSGFLSPVTIIWIIRGIFYKGEVSDLTWGTIEGIVLYE